MCGIAGIYSWRHPAAPIDAGELARISQRLAARGPDGNGVWLPENRQIGLAHRRLAILDLAERAAQPMVSDDGRLVVVFNGEIYNYQTLRAELIEAGVRLRTSSDTEVLLHLFQRHSSAMVHRLRGMFAFAIWDNLRQRLFLARDPYGIKPLYTAGNGSTFRFASQVKALLAGGGISSDPEPSGIVGFHLFGSLPEPFTLYRDIRALPAGHTQWVDAAGPREPEPFANLAAILAEGVAAPAPASELPERLRAAALDSVRSHLLADVEVGVFLSAGIDSGAVLGLMRDAGRRRIRAITLAFDEFRGTPQDETPLAAEVARRYGAQHLVRRTGEREFRDDLPAILDAMDQPSIDGINTWFVAKAAREAGIKVVLSGIGGDELLAGYPSFVDLPRWRRRFGAVAAVPGVGPLARVLIGALAPGFARSRPKAPGFLEYADSWAGAYLLRRGLFLPHELAALLDPVVAREGLQRLQPLHLLAESLVPNPGSSVGRVCALESAQYLRNQLLRDADWAGMAHGVEIRVPLVDVALLKSVAPSIPALRSGAGKVALAHSPTLPLPDAVIARPKTGFTVPTGAWISAAAGATASKTAAGLVSRRWLRRVFAESTNQLPAARAA